MKIIDIGICIDNLDPRSMGRIRCVRYSEFVSEKENALKYEPFDDNDPFVVNPFLPLNINVLPTVGQAVKIINYDPEKLNVNQEYIAGPYINIIDINSQTFTQQIENTTYGNTNKKRPNVRKTDGEYRNKKSIGFFSKEDDYGIYGKKGSDIIMIENGVVIRGGKLKNVGLTPKEKTISIDQPLMDDKIANIQLKKYPNKLKKGKKTINELNTENTKSVGTLIEYDVDNITNPTMINIIKFELKNNDKFLTTNFNQDTLIESNEYYHNTYENYTKPVTKLKESIIEINNYIFKSTKDSSIKYPIFFRPSLATKYLGENGDLLNKVKYFTSGPGNGLIWSNERIKPTEEITTTEIDVLIPDNTNSETITSVTSDKIFLLSTDQDVSSSSIDFNKVSNYEITQNQYHENIEPNTYSSVRGETLIDILKSMVKVMLTHEHNVVGPMVQNGNYSEYTELMSRIENIENDLINKKIRIN